MTTDQISISLNAGSHQLEIQLPAKRITEGAKLVLQTRLGAVIERHPLQGGQNRVSLENIKEKIIVVRVETAYETIVREIETGN